MSSRRFAISRARVRSSFATDSASGCTHSRVVFTTTMLGALLGRGNDSAIFTMA